MKSVLDAQIRKANLARPLEITWADGETRLYGEPSEDGPPPRLRFRSARAERALIVNPELRFGELFMDEEIVVERGSVFDVLMAIQSSSREFRPSALGRAVGGLRRWTRRLHQHNRRASARSNVKHHYDLDSGLYELFLDSDRQYSCAYFESEEATLEEAQLAKKRHIAAKLQLEPGMRVLDIGSGWGGLGLYLAETAEVDVTGITLSEHQHRISNQRAAARGLGDRARYLLQDYRDTAGAFDRIVSVGMFEHVGVGFYRTFFRACRNLLKEDGAALLHTIGRLEPPGGTHAWIQKYIFPGGYIPALSEVTSAIEQEDLMTCDVEVLRYHYAHTLRHWRERFLADGDRTAERFGERFCRMWEFYLAACEMAFVYRRLCVFQLQLTRRLDVLPITRDYMREREERLRQLEARAGAGAVPPEAAADPASGRDP